ncbi:MAG: hypothetical protein ABIR34_12640 [Marmoricola sp.]
MSTQQTLRFDTRPTTRRRSRRRADRLQQAIVLCLLALAVFASLRLDSLALAMTR